MYVAIVTLVQPTPDVQFESTAKFSVLYSTFRRCVPGSSTATRGWNTDCSWGARIKLAISVKRIVHNLPNPVELQLLSIYSKVPW